MMSSSSITTPKGKGLKRGRPSKKSILEEIQNRSLSPGSEVKGLPCPYAECQANGRTFPRKKSLGQHIKTHTEQKDFVCSYPGCERKFIQSGHLKTHMDTHSGDMPFSCPVPGCPIRQRHSNRRCTMHPDVKLIRDGKVMFRYPQHLTSEEKLWIKEYEAKLLQKKHFKRQRTGSRSSVSRDSFDLNDVCTSTPKKSYAGQPGTVEMDQRVPSVAEPYNFICKENSLPSGLSSPNSSTTGYSSASPDYSQNSDNSRSSSNHIYYRTMEDMASLDLSRSSSNHIHKVDLHSVEEYEIAVKLAAFPEVMYEDLKKGKWMYINGEPVLFT